MKKLNDHKQYAENPFFYAGMEYRNDGVITIAAHKMDELLKLNQFELKAFLMILHYYQSQRSWNLYEKLGVRYWHSHLLTYFDITQGKAREVTISLIEKGMIARTKESNAYFINPDYVVDLIDVKDHPPYQATYDEDGRMTDLVKVDLTKEPIPTSIHPNDQ